MIEEGAVDSSDPNVAVFTLAGPNGNFPYLVSVYNAQTPITPVSYESGTTLDASPTDRPLQAGQLRRRHRGHIRPQRRVVGRHDPAGRVGVAVLRRTGHHGHHTTAGEADAIVQFQVIGGDALFNDSNFDVLAFQAATHRQIWMRCDTGQFADKRVRQALALTSTGSR